MHQGDSSERRDIATALGMDERNLERILPGLNALGRAFFTARGHGEQVWSRALTVSGLCALGLTRSDCADLLDRGMAAVDAKRGASRRIVLADAGLVVLQAAIPLGAIRPIYDRAAHKLSVAGEIVLQLAVQARNQASILTAFELVGWPPRVARPLAGRLCGDDPQYLALATHRLRGHQKIIDFHADDGAAAWNWRPTPAGPRRKLKAK